MGRSRDRLIDAIVALIEERDPAQITVTDVVTRAQVTRPTFYNTFGDLQSAYEAATRFRLERAFTGEVAADHAQMAEVLTRILTTLHGDADFFLRVLGGPAGQRVLRVVIDFVALRLRTTSPVSAALAQGPVPVAESSQALAAGVTWWILTAIEADRNLSIDVLATRVRDYILRSVTGGLSTPL